MRSASRSAIFIAALAAIGVIVGLLHTHHRLNTKPNPLPKHLEVALSGEGLNSIADDVSQAEPTAVSRKQAFAELFSLVSAKGDVTLIVEREACYEAIQVTETLARSFGLSINFLWLQETPLLRPPQALSSLDQLEARKYDNIDACQSWLSLLAESSLSPDAEERLAELDEDLRSGSGSRSLLKASKGRKKKISRRKRKEGQDEQLQSVVDVQLESDMPTCTRKDVFAQRCFPLITTQSSTFLYLSSPTSEEIALYDGSSDKDEKGQSTYAGTGKTVRTLKSLRQSQQMRQDYDEITFVFFPLMRRKRDGTVASSFSMKGDLTPTYGQCRRLFRPLSTTTSSANGDEKGVVKEEEDQLDESATATFRAFIREASSVASEVLVSHAVLYAHLQNEGRGKSSVGAQSDLSGLHNIYYVGSTAADLCWQAAEVKQDVRQSLLKQESTLANLDMSESVDGLAGARAAVFLLNSFLHARAVAPLVSKVAYSTYLPLHIMKNVGRRERVLLVFDHSAARLSGNIEPDGFLWLKGLVGVLGQGRNVKEIHLLSRHPIPEGDTIPKNALLRMGLGKLKLVDVVSPDHFSKESAARRVVEKFVSARSAAKQQLAALMKERKAKGEEGRKEGDPAVPTTVSSAEFKDIAFSYAAENSFSTIVVKEYGSAVVEAIAQAKEMAPRTWVVVGSAHNEEIQRSWEEKKINFIYTDSSALPEKPSPHLLVDPMVGRAVVPSIGPSDSLSKAVRKNPCAQKGGCTEKSPLRVCSVIRFERYANEYGLSDIVNVVSALQSKGGLPVQMHVLVAYYGKGYVKKTAPAEFLSTLDEAEKVGVNVVFADDIAEVGDLQSFVTSTCDVGFVVRHEEEHKSGKKQWREVSDSFLAFCAQSIPVITFRHLYQPQLGSKYPAFVSSVSRQQEVAGVKVEEFAHILQQYAGAKSTTDDGGYTLASYAVWRAAHITVDSTMKVMLRPFADGY